MQLKLIEKLKKTIGRSEEAPQYFLSLATTPDSVEACIWGIIQNTTQILAISTAGYNQIDDLQLAAGRAIDKVTQQANVDVSQVIYGLPDDWIADEKVISPYAQGLKDLAKVLALEPLAFVSNTKALTHFIFQQEKTPLNAILLGVFNKSLNYTKVVSGKIDQNKITGRIDKELKDVTVEVIKDLSKNEFLPPRIIIYGSSNLEEVQSQISQIDWNQVKTQDDGKAIFLHPPRSEIFDYGTLAKSVSFAGAADLGFPAPNPIITSPSQKEETENLSFVKGADILKQQKEQEAYGLEKQAEANQEGLSLKNVGLSWTSFFADFFTGRGRVFAIISAFLAIGLILLIAAYLFLPKAKVELKLRTQPLPDKEAQIIASLSFGEVNPEKGQIPAQIFESNQNSSQKAVTTGKKQVGEKAKGKVVVYNKTTAPRTFDQGIVITSNSKLKFTLSDKITVASRSATIEGITFGKANVDVTATDIGTESNLPSGQEFTVADFDSSLFVARNDQSFSGGNSKEISVVSETDLDKLEKTLTADLLEKAKVEIQSKLTSDQKLLDKAIAAKIKSKSFDHQIGEESTIVTLTSDINFKATVFSNDNLNKALSFYAQSNLPEGFEFVSQNDQVAAEVEQIAPNGDLVFKTKLKGVLIPKLNLEEIKKNLTAKRPDAVKEYLTTFPEIVGSELILQPPLPGPMKRMPYRMSNIEIITQPE